MNIVVSEIIKVNIADTKKYSSSNRQTLNQKEQIKLRQKERKRETEGLSNKQQSTTATQGEKVRKKKKKSP